MENGKAFEISIGPGELTITLSREILYDFAKALRATPEGKTRAFKACHAIGALAEGSREVLYGHKRLPDLPLLVKALTDDAGLRVFDADENAINEPVVLPVKTPA